MADHIFIVLMVDFYVVDMYLMNSEYEIDAAVGPAMLSKIDVISLSLNEVLPVNWSMNCSSSALLIRPS